MGQNLPERGFGGVRLVNLLARAGHHVYIVGDLAEGARRGGGADEGGAVRGLEVIVRVVLLSWEENTVNYCAGS